jgi:hypothetical protein
VKEDRKKQKKKIFRGRQRRKILSILFLSRGSWFCLMGGVKVGSAHSKKKKLIGKKWVGCGVHPFFYLYILVFKKLETSGMRGH